MKLLHHEAAQAFGCGEASDASGGCEAEAGDCAISLTPLNLADMRQGPELQPAPARFSSTDPACWAEWKPPAKPRTPAAFLRDLGSFLLECAGKVSNAGGRPAAQSRAKLWAPCRAFDLAEAVVTRMNSFAPTPTDREDWFAASSAKRALILESDLWREWYVAKSWARQHGGEHRAFATFVKAKLRTRCEHYERLDYRAHGILAQVFASTPIVSR